MKYADLIITLIVHFFKNARNKLFFITSNFPDNINVDIFNDYNKLIMIFHKDIIYLSNLFNIQNIFIICQIKF